MRNPYEAKQYINTGIWKKLLAVLLTVTMLAETVPLSAFADEIPSPEQMTPETVISEIDTAAGNNDSNVEETYIPEAQTEDIPEVIPVVYQVMFDLRGHGDAIGAVSVEENGRAVKPEDPAADGYAFEGWYTDAEYENRWDFDSMPVVHDTVLYAKWTEEMNEEYTDEVSDPEIGADTDVETEDVSGGAGSADDEEMQESAESIESSGEDYSEENSASETGSDNQPEETDDVSDGDGSEADEETKELTEEDAEEENKEPEEKIESEEENTGTEEESEEDDTGVEEPEEKNKESEEDADHNSETENINELKEVSQTEASTDEKRDANAEEVIALKDTASSDAAEIAVCATAGAFPDGAALSVGEVSAEKQANVEAAVEELREEGRRVAASYTFEIKVLDEDGTTELEPADASTVRVFFAFPEAADPNLTASVYHVSTDEATGGLSAEALDVLPAEDVSIPEELDNVAQETVVAVETEGFSYYTVEFTYEEKQYVLEGDATIPLADILSAVGLSGDVEAVEVSDETLFAATQEDETWMVTALRAFSTEEWMKVTIGGVTYEITVTDDGPAQAKKTIVTGTTYTFHDHVFTDKGTLVASPASAAAGETVTLRLEADEYYGIKENSFTVHDGSGQEISLAFAAQDDGSYTFVMPDDADNDTYTITAEIEWTNAPMSGNVTTQNIVIASNIEHGTVFAKYLQYAGSTLYERINSATDAGAMKTVYDTSRPIWLYAEPEEGYELAAWKVEAVYLDELDNMDAETDGSLPVERIDDADESGDALVYPWLFELGKYYRNSNKYICFRISADFREIQEPVLEPHSITVNYRDVTSDGEATGCSASVWVQDGDNLVAVTQATKGDTVTVRVKLTNGASLSTGESGSELSIYSSTASGVEYIEYQETEQAEADEDDPNASIRTFTFVMPDRDVNILALFDFIRFTVTPAPLPDGSYIHYALFRNGTDLNHQVGAGYFDANSETWVKTEGEAEWQARPGDTLVIQLRTADLLNKNTVPGTLTLKDAGTGDPIGEPLFLKVYNESGTEYRAETSMPACDISFSVEMVNCYTVTMEDSEFGVFGVFPQKAREGETVVINAVPDDPLYDIAWSATWTDKNGELQPIEITKDPENKLRASFIMPAADVRVTGEFSQWKALQNKIDEAADGSTIRLEANYTAGGSDVSLVVDGKDVTIDLNGYAIDRNLTQAKSNVGHVFHLKNGATLTITDSSAGSGDASEDGATGAGFIKGGYANNGGGFYIDGGSTLNIEGGHIAGNRVTGSGAGIYVNNGALNMTGGCVTMNSAEGSGGGIYVNESGTLSLDSVIISDNYVGSHGGGLFLRLAGNARITNCTISNNASGKYGGGLRMDAKDRTLTISGTTISGNRSFDDGGGIHLNNGFIAMDSGSVISDNISYYDGGGVHVAGNTHFTAMDVTISGNKAYREEGGGIKNNGTVQLIDCTVRDNEAAKQGGGLFNDNDGNSAGTMTLKDCTVTGNKSDSDGGGVYSDRKLTVIGGETWGNTATHGGGMFIGGGSEATDIQKDPVIQDNEAATSGHNLYLKSGRKLALIGPLTEGSNICLDLESGTGVLTKNYRVHNGTDEPEAFFTFATGYDTRFTEEGEVEICSEWSALKKLVESAAGGTVITLEKDYAASASDDRITVSKDITIDLNGHALNRNRLSNTDDGHVLEVFSGGTLTLLDSSPDKTGVITGGWSNTGGGIYVNENGTLNLRGVRIAGNHAGTGGGVYLKGTLNITDGRIEGNIADRSGGIRTESGATVTLQGSPVVWGNTAASNGTDLYLHSKHTIGIAGPLTDGTKIGVALESDWGVFTSGYGNQNGDDTPGAYFVSTEGYGIYLENGEALIGPTTFGGTEYEDPFVSGSDQINDDVDGLGGKNWMSGLSGERLLNEINMPGSHDSGMNNVQNIKTSQGITWAVAGIAAATFVSAVVPGMQTVAASLALTAVGLSFGLPSDYTSGLSWFMEDAAAPKAKTQKEYIGEQLADGCRQLDLRLYYQHKVYKWYYGGYVYDDDGENLWVCHGKKGGGRYMAQDADGDDLSFSMVLDTVKEFLRLHPTETVILDLRPETENEKEQEKIYPRARTILEAVALDINPSTGEPYLYKDPESDDYFASYESMPKLVDCRGKIVLMPDNNDFTEKVGGFVRGDLMSGGEVLAELDYQNTKEMMVQQMGEEYSKANQRSNPVTLPSDASERLRKLWYWELNCTGQHAEYGQYYYDMDAPHKLAEYVNSHLIGDDKILGEQRTGQYIGWVRMDSFNGKYAEEIWKTNFFDTLDYCTVTVKSGLEDESHYPDQSYLILSGTRLTVPENIYKKLDDGWYFAFWESETGKRYNPGDKLEVTGDIILTARWLGDGEIPIRATWKDADDKDGLRPDNLNLAVSVAGKPLSVTLTADGGWMGTIHALVGMKDQIVITPEWSRIVMSGGNYGTDTEEQYRFELSYEIGTGYTLTLIHTPRGSVLAAGEVKWEDSDNAAGKRPETVTVRLYKNGEPTGGIAEVSAEYGWQYTFGERTQYENGEENFYTVVQNEIENYVTKIDGFTIVNKYSPDAQGTVNVEGLIQWDDAGNAKGLRPEKILVHLKADGKETDSQEVESSGLELWYWTFDNVLLTDETGRITYTVDPQQVEGYTVTCERIGLVEADSQDGSGSGAQGDASDAGAEEEEDVESYTFLITYTLEVTDEEKTDAAVTRVPVARELSYSATAQELIEEGEAEGGRLMYALGDSADTPPDASAFTAELPVGTDAGTYHVWYYVRADVMHRDSAPQHLAVTVGKAVPVIDAHDLRLTDGDVGRTVEAAVTGVEGETEGPGALHYEVTEGDAVTVDASTGALTVHSTGIAELTLSVPETTNYIAATATVTVTVVHQHALTEIAAKAATCTEDGNITYWLCAGGDGRCFSDAEGIHEITKEETVIPALGHDWGEWTVTKEATETEEGEETRVCQNDPTHVETRMIPMKEHVHQLTKIEAKAASCEEEGNIAYWVCSRGENPCGRYFSDAEGTTEILLPQTVIPAAGHTVETREENRKEATCTEAGSFDLVSVCTVCGKELNRRGMTIAALEHQWDEGIVTTEATCTTAGVKTYTCTRDASHTRTEEIAPLGHDWGEWEVTKEATETEEGEETRVCGHDRSHVETRVIPMKEHVHQLTKVEAKAASCEEDGNTACWVCSGGENPCGRYFSDAEGKSGISIEDTVIHALGHAWDEGTVTREAGCTTEGERVYTCLRDHSHTKTETISPTGHKGNFEWRDEIITEADCTHAGYYYHTYYCLDCGEILTYQLRVNPAPGHDWGEWEVSKKATAEETGLKTRTCKNNPAHTETEIISRLSTTAPAAITGLAFNEETQPLVAAGTAEGGTLQYALGTDAAGAPAEAWSTSVPEALNAGTYAVWYRIVGDSEHTDTEPVCIEVTISRAAAEIRYPQESVIKQYDEPAFTNPLTKSGDGTVAYTSGDASVATVNAEGLVTIKGIGTATITAAATDGANYRYDPAEASYELTVVKKTASVSFAQAEVEKTFGDEPFINPLTDTGDGTAVYTSGDESVAAVNPVTGEVSIVGTGKVTIAAAAADGEYCHYDPAEASYVLNVAKKPASISFARTEIEKTWGDEPFDNPLMNGGDGTVAYASDNESVAAVDSVTGEVTLVSAGEAAITATVTDGATSSYPEKQASYQLTVKKADNPGFVSGSATVTRGGNALSLKDLVRNAEGQVRYAVSGEALGCTVDEDGVFRSGNETGTVTVSVTFTGNDRYNQKTVDMTIHVAEKTTRRLSGSATRIYGDPLDLPIYIYDHIPEDARPDARYTGTLRSGAAWDSELPPTETGAYILTLTYEDSETIWIETITFQIMPRQLGRPDVTLGDALTYNGSEQTQTVASVLWGEDLVPASEYTVTNNRGTDAGDYTLTVTATPTGNYTGSVTKDFTISRAKGEISFASALINKTCGDEAFTNELMNTGDGTVTYVSADEAVATVNSVTGEVTIKGAGETTISAAANDGRNYQYDLTAISYRLTVAKKQAAISYATVYVAKTCGDPAFTNPLTNSGDATVSYMSSNTNVAAVDAATGEVMILGVGSTTVTAVAGESANYRYDYAMASYTLTVAKKPAAIGFEQASVRKTYGDPAFTIALTNSGDGTVSYSSNNTNVAAVDAATGEVTIRAAGEATITATAAEGAASTYPVRTANCQVTVEKAANPAIIAASANVQTEGKLSLSKKISGQVGRVSYAIDGDANGCTVDPNTGVFTAGNTLGDVMVTVTVAEDQNHMSKTGSIRVHVTGQSVVSPELLRVGITYGEEKLDEVIRGHIWEGATPSIHYTGTTRSGAAYDSDVAPKYAGEYLVTISYEYSEGIYDGLAVATILPKSLEGATVNLGKTLTYNGSEQTQKVESVMIGGAEVPVKAYTVTDNRGTKAESYTLTVTANPNGNYADSVTKEFTIAQAKGKLSYAEETVSKTWGDDAFTNKLTNTGDLRVTYSSSNSDVATVDPDGKVTITGVGTAKITATATAAENENYYFEPGTAASYTLNVAKAASTVSVPPAPVQDLEYNGGQQALVSAGETPNGTMQYALGTDASTPPADSAFSKDIPTGKDAGTYYVWYKVVGDDNHSDNKVLSPVTVTVRKLDAELVWSDTPLTYDGKAKAPAASVSNLIDGDSCEVTVEGAQTNAGTYTARASALSNGNYKLPENATADFTIQKAEGAISFATDTVSKTWGDESFTIKPTIEGDGTVTYESSNPNVSTVDADGKVTIIGAGEATITATAVEGTNTSYNLSPTASYTLTVAPAEAEVYKAPATVMGLGYTGAPQLLVSPGEAIGGTMQYMIADDGKTPPADDAPWSTSLPSGTDAGIYYVWYRVVGDDNHNSTAQVSVTGYIATAASRGSVEANTLYYTGTAQNLVELVEAEGGELMYALGTDAVTPPDLTSDVWSNQIPQGTDVDTYYVWYYVKGGDDNHRDTAPAVREVTIQPKAVSYDVTFTVSHGSWNDGSTADVVVKLEGYETQDSSPLKLSPADIPAVGNSPERYYTTGSWNVTPDTNTAITKNTTYTYSYQKIAYTLTEGEGQTYTKGSAASLRFVIKRAPDDGPAYSHFTAVTYGTALLTRDQDYTAASGSLVLTLQPAFLETLEPGTHSVNVAFDDAADPVMVPFTVAPAVYTVTFNANGRGSAPAAQRVTDGDKATKPTDPAAEGYTFGGWYTEAQCRNAYNFTTPVTANLTLYAKWTANSSESNTSGSDSPGSSSSSSNSSNSSSSSASRSSSVTGPKTGDPGRTGLWVVMLLISMAGLCGIAVTYDKSRRKETYLGKAGQDEGGQGHN